MSADSLLDIQNLTVAFRTYAGEATAVDNVSISLRPGETLGIVGESGSGKSVLSLGIMRLLPQPPAQYVSGRIIFGGEDLLQKSEAEMCSMRGSRIAMIFQEPMTALNPVYTVGQQIDEVLVLHTGLNAAQRRERVIELLRQVRIPAPESRVDAYPHQLSGGMRQRAMIAIALACNPSLLIADEPTTALDVTVQAQILHLMRELRAATNTAIILITHDLGVIAEMADRVAVMYGGRVVEQAAVLDLFDNPMHPYTIGMMASIPHIAVHADRLSSIPGSVPPLTEIFDGCRFHPRCPFASDQCRQARPPLQTIDNGHQVACWHAPIEQGARLVS